MRKPPIYLDSGQYGVMDQFSKSFLIDYCVELIRRMDGADLSGDGLLVKLMQYAIPVAGARGDAMPTSFAGGEHGRWLGKIKTEAQRRASKAG